MTQTVQQALQDARFYSDAQSYRLVQLPANGITAAAGIVAEVGMPFCALLVDQNEVTLMLPEDACQAFQNRLRFGTISSTVYRLITLDIVLEPTLVGFMALVSKTLAAAGISIMPFAAYSRDHIFVPAADFENALSALQALQNRMGT